MDLVSMVASGTNPLWIPREDCLFMYTHTHIYIYIYICMYICIYIYIYTFYIDLGESFFKSCLIQFQGVASLIFRELANKLDNSAGVAVVALSLKSAWKQTSFFFQGTSVFLLSSSTDWMKPGNIMQGNLLYLKSTYLNNNVKK